MKKIISNIIHSITGFVTTHTVVAVLIAVTVAATAVAVPIGAHYVNADKPQSVGEIDSSVVSSNEDQTFIDETTSSDTSSVVDEDIVSREATASENNSSEAVSQENTSSESDSSKPSQSKPTGQTSSKNNTSSKAQNTSSQNKPVVNKPKPSGKKDYLDTSSLTGTQADKGKVVGYTSLLAQDIKVVSVVERTTADGRKVVETIYSFGPSTKIVECEYCHKMPCPNGGGDKCSEYNTKEDATVTCQTCGRPQGNGYNGTCENLIDWANGGRISCNHYD